MNNSIPILSPPITTLVWEPWKVLSRTTSRHHKNLIKNTKIDDTIIKSISTKANILIIPIIKAKTLNPAIKGHGDIFTIW